MLGSSFFITQPTRQDKQVRQARTHAFTYDVIMHPMSLKFPRQNMLTRELLENTSHYCAMQHGINVKGISQLPLQRGKIYGYFFMCATFLQSKLNAILTPELPYTAHHSDSNGDLSNGCCSEQANDLMSYHVPVLQYITLLNHKTLSHFNLKQYFSL